VLVPPRNLDDWRGPLRGALSAEEVCRQFGIAESTWARWLFQYGGMKADDAKRLKGLEGENTRLKKILAEAELEKALSQHPGRYRAAHFGPWASRFGCCALDGGVSAPRAPVSCSVVRWFVWSGA
jgi:putative transposase